MHYVVSKIFCEKNPIVARIIISREWEGEIEHAKALLNTIMHKWPSGTRVWFIITSGGFIEAPWPSDISSKDVPDARNPRPYIVKRLMNIAENYVIRYLLTDSQIGLLKQIARYITLGVDMHMDINNLRKSHVELVGVFDLTLEKFVLWTGKSYPKSNQPGLTCITDINSHFYAFEGIGETLILGCHDLKVFDPYHYNNPRRSEWRKEIIAKFHNIAKQRKPILVLQHPHTTVKVRTWQNAWKYLVKLVPSVRYYASAWRYYDPRVHPSKYNTLLDVLKATKSRETHTIDFVVDQ